MEINKLITGILIATMLCGIGGIASAYDANTPWTGTVRWTVPSDTTFSIAFAGAETEVDFDDSLTAQTQSGIQPDSQDNTTSTPIIVVTNEGNLALNFTCNLTAAKPSWAVLKVNDETSYTGATTFDTTAVEVKANVATAQSANMYLWTDITSAPSGTISRTLQINSAIA